MEKYYEELNAKCQEVAKDVIKDNSILSDNMLKAEERNFLLSDWNAFLIGLIADQSVKAEMAWRLPYYLSKRLGYFDFDKIIKEQTIESLEAIIKEKPALHRYPRKMAEYVFFAIKTIVEKYDSKAQNIWKNDLNAEHVVAKLEEFKGISHKKAALGTLLLVRDFGVTLNNLSCIDIAYDVHVRRIFLRMGLTDKDNIKDVTAEARNICNEFPGSLTLPFWVAGREYCRPTNPNCEECYLNRFCMKKTELGKDL